MTNSVRISCINKTNRPDPHDRISHVGGLSADGGRWKVPEPDAISRIERGEWACYVERPQGDRVDVVATRLGIKYLKTRADGDQPNNLLALPECP